MENDWCDKASKEIYNKILYTPAELKDLATDEVINLAKMIIMYTNEKEHDDLEDVASQIVKSSVTCFVKEEN